MKDMRDFVGEHPELFITGYFHDMWMAGMQPAKEPKSSLPEVTEGATMELEFGNPFDE